MNGSIQGMKEFVETRIESLKRFDSKKDSNKGQKTKYKKKLSDQNVSEEKISQGTESRKKLSQHDSTCDHSINEFTTIKTLIKQAKLKKAN